MTENYVADHEQDQAAGRSSTAALQWHPIETAPKDGTWFLICRRGEDEGSFEIGRYDPMPWECYVEIDSGSGLYRKQTAILSEWRGFNNFHRATHWMSLPTPPGASS